MKRWKKRLWTTGLISGSAVLIIAAVLMGAVRVIDLAAPRYRQLLANQITETIEQPVEVGSIGMNWRRMRPTVVLDEVVILHPQSRRPVFKLEAVQVPFKWAALFRASFEPAEIILEGMEVTLEWRPDGSVGVKGIEFLSDTQQPSEALDIKTVFSQLQQLGHVEVRDSKLAWLDLGGPRGLDHISNLNAELLAEAGEYSLEIEAELPPELGSKIRLQAFMKGEANTLEELKTKVDIEVDGLSVQGWLQPVLQEGLNLRGGPANVQIKSQWQGLQPTQANLILESPPQASWRDQALVRTLPGLEARMALAVDTEGWQATIESLQYQDVEGTGPASTGKIEYRPVYGGFGDLIKGELDLVRVRDLLAWSSVLAPSAALPLPAEVGGELQKMRFSYERTPAAAPKVAMQAQLKSFDMPVTGPLPGISGLDGAVEFKDNIATIDLASQDGQLLLPQVFNNPVPLTELNTRIQARQIEQGWALASETLSLHANTVKAEGKLGLEIYADQNLPSIDLQLAFKASDVLPAKPLIPIAPALPSEVGEWLQDSILGGQVPKGEMVLRGPLGAFPFEGKDADKGEFRVEFDVINAQLEYAPGWPKVTDIKGHAVFAGLSMHIDAESGKVLGVPVSQVKAGIKDFRSPDLLITGSVEAALQKQLNFLQESPLSEDYAALLEVLKLQGPGALDLELKLPLANLDDTQVTGVVHAKGGQLDFKGLPYPVTDLKGEVNFTADGLSGEGIQGRFLGVPATADLMPQTGAEGKAGTQLKASFQLKMPEHAEALKSLLGDAVPLFFLSGETSVHLASRFSADGEASKLQINTDLKGMTSQFGAPFSKSADDIRRLRLGILPETERLLVDWNYIDAVRGQIELRDEQPQGWVVSRGTVRLGPLEDNQSLTLAQEAGWDIRGDLPLLDIPMLELGGDGELPTLKALDVHVGLLKIAEQKIRDIRVKLEPAGNVLQLSGPDTEGRLQWSDVAGRKRIDADFRRLVLTAPKKLPGQTDAQQGVEDQSEPLDPAGLPAINLLVEQLILGDQVLGNLTLKAVAVPNGLKLESFRLLGKKLQMSASGDWLRFDGQSSATLKGNFESDDIRDILKAAGYAPHVVAESALGGVDLHWTPNPKGLEMTGLNGEIGFKFIDGSLLAVEPGAGRVLSLISFYSIPRRLTLDFRDVTGEGTAFDRLTGNFRIENGDAYTNDMQMESPSIEIDVDGRVGLAARDYDQVVTIQPELSSSVAFAGAVFGGPVLGLGLWLAQELLDEPLEQATILRYRMTGPWDNPSIEPLEGKKRPPAPKGKPGAARSPTTPKPAEAPDKPVANTQSEAGPR